MIAANKQCATHIICHTKKKNNLKVPASMAGIFMKNCCSTNDENYVK